MNMIPFATVVLGFVGFLFLSSCTTHRISNNPTYWQHISKDTNYELIEPVKGYTKHLSSPISGNQNRIDCRILKTASPGEGVFTIPPKTTIQPKLVYVDSSPLQYYFVSYIALISGGMYDGMRVDFTNLLQRYSDGYHPNQKYLLKVDD